MSADALRDLRQLAAALAGFGLAWVLSGAAPLLLVTLASAAGLAVACEDAEHEERGR